MNGGITCVGDEMVRTAQLAAALYIWVVVVIGGFAIQLTFVLFEGDFLPDMPQKLTVTNG